MTVEDPPMLPPEQWWSIADANQIMAYIAYLWIDSANRYAEQSTLSEFVKSQCQGD